MKFFKQNFFFFLIALNLCSFSELYSASATWSANFTQSNGNWTDTANWTPATIPGPGDTATFPSFTTNFLTIPELLSTVNVSNTALGTLNIQDAYTFSRTGPGGMSPNIINYTLTTAIFNNGLTINGGVFLSGVFNFTASNSAFFSGTNTLTSININTGGGTLELNAGSNTITDITLGAGGPTLFGSGTITGNVVVNSGILGTSGTITGNLTVNGGIITPGTDDDLTSSIAGVTPPLPIAIISVGGNYIQAAGVQYQINIGPTQTDLIQVTGTANLAGSIFAFPAVGAYPVSTAQTILSATGGITGTLSPNFLVYFPNAFSIHTSANGQNLILSILQNVIIPPSTVPSNNANDHAHLDFIGGFDPTNQATFDLAAILLGNGQVQPFLGRMRLIAPFQNGLNRFIRLLNSLGAAQNARGRGQLTYCGDCPPEKNEEFIAPLFLYSHANEKERVPGFDNYAEGATIGYQRQIFQRALENSNWMGQFTGGITYLHSKAFFYTNRGSANQNNFYVTGTGSFTNPEIATELQLTVQYDGGSNTITRTIALQPSFGLADVGSSESWSNALLFGCDALINPQFIVWQSEEDANEFKVNTFSVAPQAGVYTYFLWSGAFEEKGAGNLDLRGQSEQATWIVPNARLNLTEQYKTENLCFKPSVHAGWIGYYPLRANRVTSGLYNLDNNVNLITINVNPADHQYLNQFTTGFSFAISKCEKFMFEFASEVKLFDDVTSVDTTAKIQLNF